MSWQCNCGSGFAKYELRDTYGIFCTFVCDDCVRKKRKEFRPEIFDGPYELDGPIEDE